MNDDEVKKLSSSKDPVTSGLAREVLKLRAAIRSHRDKTGHELCWINDVELWKTLGENAHYPHETMPVREEFLKQCSAFYESRVKGTPYQEPTPKKTLGD